MKDWLTSANGIITFSLLTFLTFVGRGFLDWRYEYPIQDPAGNWDTPGTLIYLTLAGVWLWGLLAGERGSRRGWIVALVCGLLAGCSGSAQTVTIRTDGMRFVADEVRLRAGEPVTLRIVNRDGYAHAFDIDEFDIHRSLAAKEIAEITLSPERAGSYRFYCGSPGHEQAGMEGVLVVEP